MDYFATFYIKPTRYLATNLPLKNLKLFQKKYLLSKHFAETSNIVWFF